MRVSADRAVLISVNPECDKVSPFIRLHLHHNGPAMLLAGFAAELTGFSFSDMTLDVWIAFATHLKGCGFSLPIDQTYPLLPQ